MTHVYWRFDEKAFSGRRENALLAEWLSVCLRLLNIALSLKWRAIETEPRRQALSHNTRTHTREPTVDVCVRVRAFTPESVKLETETSLIVADNVQLLTFFCIFNNPSSSIGSISYISSFKNI